MYHILHVIENTWFASLKRQNNSKSLSFFQIFTLKFTLGSSVALVSSQTQTQSQSQSQSQNR